MTFDDAVTAARENRWSVITDHDNDYCYHLLGPTPGERYSTDFHATLDDAQFAFVDLWERASLMPRSTAKPTWYET